MEDRRHRQETGEAGQVADERLGLNLLLEIHLHIRLERLPSVRGSPDHGQAAVAEHLGQIEVSTQLLWEERKHLPVQRPPRQQVGARLFQFAGARPQENEPHPLVFDEAVHLVEQRRQPLNLIHDDRCPAGECPQFVGKQAGLP